MSFDEQENIVVLKAYYNEEEDLCYLLNTDSEDWFEWQDEYDEWSAVFVDSTDSLTFDHEFYDDTEADGWIIPGSDWTC